MTRRDNSNTFLQRVSRKVSKAILPVSGLWLVPAAVLGLHSVSGGMTDYLLGLGAALAGAIVFTVMVAAAISVFDG